MYLHIGIVWHLRVGSRFTLSADMRLALIFSFNSYVSIPNNSQNVKLVTVQIWTSGKTSGNIWRGVTFAAYKVPKGKQGTVRKGNRTNKGTALRYRQHGEQTVIVSVLMHYLQPNMSVGFQEVIIIFVPEGMRYNRVWHCGENKGWIERQERKDDIWMGETPVESSHLKASRPALKLTNLLTKTINAPCIVNTV